MSKINNFNKLNTKKYYIRKKINNSKKITKKKIISIQGKNKTKKKVKHYKLNTNFSKKIILKIILIRKLILVII